MSFKGKVVAITGAAGGIGQSLCRYFANEGAVIAAIDKSASLTDFAAELVNEKVSVRHVIADVGDPRATKHVWSH